MLLKYKRHCHLQIVYNTIGGDYEIMLVLIIGGGKNENNTEFGTKNQSRNRKNK